MGKHDALVARLPKAGPEGEPKFRERVEAYKRGLTSEGPMKPAQIAAQYADARQRKDALAAQESTINVEIQALEELLHTTFEEEGLASLRLADGSSVSVSREPNAAILDKARLLAWAKANGYEGMLTMAWQSVNALAKEILSEGGDVALNDDGDMTVMDGAVRVTSRPKTTLRRS